MLPGAYVYAPIEDFSTDDVWTYLLQVLSPWGSNNRDLAALYRNASAGECPLVIDDSTPSCGNSRFGCWVCTVASRDTSMEAMIDNGEEWLEPLLEFRDWLMETIDPARKREFRDYKGRDGKVKQKSDGTLISPSKKRASKSARCSTRRRTKSFLPAALRNQTTSPCSASPNNMPTGAITSSPASLNTKPYSTRAIILNRKAVASLTCP